jgi:hypothetical protein
LETEVLPQDELRVELKASFRAIDYDNIKFCLLSGAIPARPLHPARTIQSLYLDTPNGRAVAENLAGLSSRVKYRYRWYGEAVEHAAGILEKKIRVNGLGRKDRLACHSPVKLKGTPKHSFIRTLVDASPADWAAELASLVPAQWIRYRREYFAVDGGLVRITLDHDLHCYDQRPYASLQCDYATPVPGLSVLEIKTAPENLELARLVLSSLPVHVDKCSKFMAASQPAFITVAPSLLGG